MSFKGHNSYEESTDDFVYVDLFKSKILFDLHFFKRWYLSIDYEGPDFSVNRY